MKKQLLYTGVIVTLALSLGITATAKAEERSWYSWLIEKYFWIKGDKKYYSPQNEAEFDHYVKSAGEVANKGFDLQPSEVNGDLKTDATTYQMQIHSWNEAPNPASQKVILYLHGGSYLNNPTSYHIEMLNILSRSLDAKIVLPIYPKAPTYKYSDVMPHLVDLYRDILQETAAKNVTIMGDSAGGGLALGLAQAIREEKDRGFLEQPKDIILLSPWLDVTMSNPAITAFEKDDPILSAWGLKRVGTLWAGGANNTQHPYVSPMYGDMAGLAKITMFTGTHDIFYPDIALFHENWKVRRPGDQLIEAKDMNHVYPIYPIEEAKEAQYKIIDIIRQESK
ncbi:alpha/beta hydrolase [Streptococcus gallolyticus]|nr:alpha/beta hydrolase [Streptococcus gallolyticus]MBY5041278.1 alpha/beta hydrolase [Streptococcus gallolyticus]